VLGLPANVASREIPGNGDEDRVEGDDAERCVDNVEARVSVAVVRRDSSSSPSCESRSSCTPTVQPDRKVGSEYAIEAVMLADDVRKDSDTGGHAVCDRKE
jgi:hypothetical protein